MSDARQTFSVRSDAYAEARPRYPAALYEWVLEHCPEREAVWDCATGNGQAAIDLALYFRKVYASDISAEQIAHCEPRQNVEYQVLAAEKTDYPRASFDLITSGSLSGCFYRLRFDADSSVNAYMSCRQVCEVCHA